MIGNYINGEWRESQSKETVDVVNPATGKLLEKCPLGNREEVDQAVQAAKKAYKSWRQVPTVERVQPFFKLKNLMEENLEGLSRQVTIENGKILAEARGSVKRAIQMIETACGMPTLMMGEHSEDIAAGIDCQAVHRPMGVFAAIAPFNFPVMVPFWFWPFAVASGNSFIVKPSERVPLSQMKIFELIDQAAFPKGIINMVHGGRDVVNALCTHPDIKGISFVGSTPVARHVYETSTAAGKRCQALGGAKNFMVVLPDAELDRSCRVAYESITGCAGERCLAGSVVVCVGDETYKRVSEKMGPMASDLIIGDGLEKTTQMGPVISSASKERIKSLIQSAVDEGAELLVDGRKNVDERPGFFLRPTVIGGVRPEMKVAKEEIFGPVILLAKTKTFNEAIAWINSSPFANTTTLFTTNGAAARKFSYEVDPSMIGINIGVPAPMAFFSFGGAKDSFFGDSKAHGKACVNFFTDTKVTIQRWSQDSSIW
ncbi:MAG: CoA-acylating methylmalonate-semialdehyde dehydrogenase [Deltaproteobacteria bacterium]|nr:CoA-acylating methylmalonate-semialdehyde dehydrogenase [Deltaproteobacteria bacterium]